MNHRTPPPANTRGTDTRDRFGSSSQTADSDGLDRIISAALRSMPLSAPPDDFAACVAASATREDRVLERRLLRGLLAMLVLAGALLVIRYGQYWWQPLQQRLGLETMGWLLTAAGCLAATCGARLIPGRSARA